MGLLNYLNRKSEESRNKHMERVMQVRKEIEEREQMRMTNLEKKTSRTELSDYEKEELARLRTKFGKDVSTPIANTPSAIRFSQVKPIVLDKTGLPKTSEGMTVNDYAAVVGPLVRPYWVRPEIIKITGIRDVFADNIELSKKLSKEEFETCYNAIMDMIEVYGAVLNKFCAESDKLQEKYPMELRNRKVYVAEEKQQYHCTETIIRLLQEFKDVKAEPLVNTYTEDQYGETIVRMIESIKNTELAFLGMIVLQAQVKYFEMLI